ncbi:hypothetical protein HPB51_008230 [Rhipicephalus microplus]|uniref:Uncharacterized protein n=1 Tax=Rhipicephalus microplus TaxID=6941 RepID=A0A9J6EZI2_RHIMP|nr:hypothetical protein HPB51_008230 [Rhipicephalus microplus]
MFTTSQMAWLRKLYHWDWPKDSQDTQKIKEAQEGRARQLEHLKTCLDYELRDIENLKEPLDKNGLEEPACPSELVALCRDLKERPPIGETLDADLVHAAGCTCDLDSTLPHHPSSKQEVSDLIASTARFLQSLCAVPAVITIARSSIDAYCPPEEVDFIQCSVIDMLRSVYAATSTEASFHLAWHLAPDESAPPPVPPPAGPEHKRNDTQRAEASLLVRPERQRAHGGPQIASKRQAKEGGDVVFQAPLCHERSEPAKDRLLKLLPDVDSSPSPARRKRATVRFPRQFGRRLHPNRNKLVFNRSRLSELFWTTATNAYVYGPTTTPDITACFFLLI